MSESWIISVLADLRDYAEKQGLQATVAGLENLKHVAEEEMAILTEPAGLGRRQSAVSCKAGG